MRSARRGRDAFQLDEQREASGDDMKRKAKDRDTMRPEYDFASGVRGVTAKRYARGTNIVVIAPEVLDVFPDGPSVNAALKALAPVIRNGRRKAQRAAAQRSSR